MQAIETGQYSKVDYSKGSIRALPRQCGTYLDATVDILEDFNLLVPD